MTNLILGPAVGSSVLGKARYPGHNLVAFDGTGDVLRRGAGIWSASVKYFTMFADFVTPASFGTIQRIWLGAAQFNLSIDVAGLLAFNCSATGIASSSDINGGALSTSTRYRCLIAMKGESTAGAADSVQKIWLSPYGLAPVLKVDGGYSTQAEFLTISGQTNFSIGGPNSGTANLWAGQMAAVWITGHNSNSAHYIADVTKFFGAGDVDLGTNGSLPGVQPLVFFGGRQVAGSAGDGTNWNAGKNLGTAGDFTMTGDVTS